MEKLIFDKSAAESILKSFDYSVAKDGGIWQKEVSDQCAATGQCVFCSKSLNVKDFGGIINFEGEPRLICNNAKCLIITSKYLGDGD